MTDQQIVNEEQILLLYANDRVCLPIYCSAFELFRLPSGFASEAWCNHASVFFTPASSSSSPLVFL